MGTAFWEGGHAPASQDGGWEVPLGSVSFQEANLHDPGLQIQQIPVRLPHLYPVPNGVIHGHTCETKALLG